jgi:DNA-binding transcriptional MerR regulator
MASPAAAPKPVEIPNRLYFRIGDVARLTGIKSYVLRFWESEFPQLSPKKSGTNQRLYRRKDVEMVLEIKRLLYEKRFTIEGARTFLQQRKSAARVEPAPAPRTQGQLFGPAPGQISLIRKELHEILALLS